MAMASRAARDTSKSIVGIYTTPEGVGPASYVPGTALRSAPRSSPNFAGFASSSARDVCKNGTTSATTPGPGSYVALKGNGARRKCGTNNFKTQVARLCPSAPGSTVFKASSAGDTPGPGNYVNPFDEPMQGPRPPPNPPRRNAGAYRALVSSDDSFVQRFNPPTIPRREQSNGYESDALGVRPLPISDEVRTGLGCDTVGPAFYDPPPTLRTDGTNFGKSRVTRECEGLYDIKPIPGPGDYNPPLKLEARSRMTRSAEGSSAFKSRIPVAQDVVVRSQTNSLGPGEFLGPAQNRVDWPSVLQCFGTNSERVGWDRHASLPYAAPSYSSAPGPGSYANAPSFKTPIQKRLTDEPISFNSTDARPCLRPGGGGGGGPGEYDLANTDVVSTITRRTVGRHGIFGTCSSRFSRAGLPPDVAKLLQYRKEVTHDAAPAQGTRRYAQESPGPGQYEIAGLLSPVHEGATTRPRRDRTLAFKSQVSRFRPYDTRAPEAVQLGPRQVPGVGEYRIRSEFSRNPTQRPQPSAALQSKTPRFGAAVTLGGAAIADTPGPGAYRTSQANTRWQNGVGLPNDSRFRQAANGTSNDVGPGSYVKHDDPRSKTFNITYGGSIARKK